MFDGNPYLTLPWAPSPATLQAFNRARAGYIPAHDPRVAMREPPASRTTDGDEGGEAAGTQGTDNGGESDGDDSDGDADDTDGEDEDDDGPGAGGVMAGLTDIELVVTDAAESVNVAETLRTGVADVLDKLQGGGVVASTAQGTALQTDFERDFFVRTHPVSFPHGTGRIPAGMSRECYAKLIVQRQMGRPLARGGEDVPLFLALFNVTQRHRVLTETRVRMAGTPADFARLDGVTAADASRVLDALARGMGARAGSARRLCAHVALMCGTCLTQPQPRATAAGTFGASLERVLDECDDPALARLLLSKARVATGKISGTPGAMSMFRNKMTAIAYALGTFTVFPTLNPLEMRSPEVMRLCGLGYEFDELGHPDDSRPDATTRNITVASHPAACAASFGAVVDALQEVGYGWKLKAPRQGEPDCLFGQV